MNRTSMAGGGGEQNYSEGGDNTSLDWGEELTEHDWESIEQYRWGRWWSIDQLYLIIE